MNTQSMNKIILALVCTICPSACLAAGGQVEYFEVAEPIYADQTYTKTGGACMLRARTLNKRGWQDASEAMARSSAAPSSVLDTNAPPAASGSAARPWATACLTPL